MKTKETTALGDRLVSVGELASFLNVSTAVIYRLIGEGTLPYVRVGRQVRFSPTAIRQYLDAQRSGGMRQP